MEGLQIPGPSSGPGPLDGLTAIEIGNESGEYCGLVLACLGANLVKVEPPGGSTSRAIGPFYEDIEDPERSLHFWAYNRSKESVVLDLDRSEDIDRLDALLQSADVVLDSTVPGSTEHRALARCDFSHSIHGRLTPFGEDGPWANYKTCDLVSLALGGVTMNCGYDPMPDGTYDLPPIAPQAWHSFHIAGEQLAIGLVAALIRRQDIGQVQKVSVSIHEAVAKNTELDVTSWTMLRQEIGRQTCRHASATLTDPSISYTKDGRWILAMSLGQRDRSRLGPFMHRYGLGEDPEEEEDEATVELVRPIGGSTAAATSNTEIVQRLARRFTYGSLPWREAQAEGLLWAPLRKPHENTTDEHWLSRSTFADVFHPEINRSLRYPVSKWISTSSSWSTGRRAPLIGEDTERLLAPTRTADVAPRSRAQPRSTGDKDEALSLLNRPFPLQGIRILDFTWFLASAGATRFLASLGAEVIKIEWKSHPDSGRGMMVPVGGRAAREKATGPLPADRDPTVGGQFNNKNPGKRGLSLNVADPRGLEIARALVPKCDVVAEGFSPGVLERWGLGYDVLKELRPDVIYVKQSGMGAFGQYGRFRCLGPIAAALAGVSDMSGLPEPAPPAGWGYSYLDWFGAYSMALSVLTAIYHRNQTGQGQWIDASQTEVGIFLTAPQVLDWSANKRAWSRTGNRSPFKRAAPHGIFPCRGTDRWIAIACFTEAEWQALAAIADHVDWLDDPRFTSLEHRLAEQDDLDACIAAWTRVHEPFELMHALQEAGVPAGVCQTAADRYDADPQLRHLQWLTELESTGLGKWPLAETSIRFSQTPAHIGGLTKRGAPLYGEDNVAILTELLDLSESEIAKLTAEGVL